MNAGSYLPSKRFTTIVASVLLAGGLIYAAHYLTSPRPATIAIEAGQPAAADEWRASLESIQASTAFAAAPAPPNQETINAFLDEAESDNLTSTVARSLFVQLSEAKAQGLGSDIPTQEELIAAAEAHIGNINTRPAYTSAAIRVVPQTKDALHAYGNAVIETMIAHPADGMETLRIIGEAIDGAAPDKLRQLAATERAYGALAEALVAVPVPQPLAPLHLKIVNNVAGIANAHTDIALVFDDALRGVGGLATFQALTDELQRVFTTVAESLHNGGILFTKDEPGSAWSVFLPGSSFTQ